MAISVACMCMAAVMLVAAVGGAQAAAAASSDNFILTVPAEPIDELLQSYIPALEKKINSIKLPTCCYDDVGVDHVHLNIEDLAISNTKATFALDASTGLGISTGISLQVNGNYRLCIHLDPFSSHACDTIEGCKGDFQVSPAVNLGVQGVLGATNDGHLKLTLTPTSVSLALNNNLCSLIKGKIQDALPGVQKSLTKELTAVLQNITNHVMTIFPREVYHNHLFSVTMLAGPSSAVNKGAVLVGGRLDVALDKSKQSAPFNQKYPIASPSASALAGMSNIIIGDSFASNILWAAQSKQPLALHFNMTDGQPLWVRLEQDQNQPMVMFNETEQSVLLSGPMIVGKANSTEPLFNVSVVIKLGVEVSIDRAPKGSNFSFVAYLNLAGDSGFQSVEGDCGSLCSDLIQKISVKLSVVIKLVNEFLKDNPIPLPTPKHMDISQLTFSSGLGYISIGAAVKPNVEKDGFAQEMSDAVTHDLLPNANAVQCPNIPHAHQDKCI
eukprot:m.49777 g.49777  ORF g.49777 m.49777 type:complete len:498 (+) comp12854_c0_seq1:29-1522(+)